MSLSVASRRVRYLLRVVNDDDVGLVVLVSGYRQRLKIGLGGSDISFTPGLLVFEGAGAGVRDNTDSTFVHKTENVLSREFNFF